MENDGILSGVKIDEIRDIHVDGEGTDGSTTVNEKEMTSEKNAEILIIGDLVLKELKSNMFLKTNCCVRIRNDLGFSNASTAADCLPDFPQLKSVFVHCGFKYSKKVIYRFVQEDIEETIDKLDEQYPHANVYISGVLPFRSNKNRPKIDLLNAIIAEVCNETSAEFVDLTSALVDENSGSIDNIMYRDTVTLSRKGTRRVVER